MKLNWQEHLYQEQGERYTVFTAPLPNGRWDAELVFAGGGFTIGQDGAGFESSDEACQWGRRLAAQHLASAGSAGIPSR